MIWIVILLVLVVVVQGHSTLMNDAIFDPKSEYNVFTRNEDGVTFGMVDCYDSLRTTAMKEKGKRNIMYRGKFRKLFFEYGVST